MNALLSLVGIGAGYGANQVLRGVSLDVPEGSLTAIIGPNGHGKTTLLRAISGLVPLNAGTIYFAGQPLARMRPDEIVAAGIVHVPQGDLLFPEMSVLDNLQMGAYLPEATKQVKARLDEVFALLPKLKERRSQIASTLSGGERRMVGIGRGLMAGGKLLMLDEPSLGLAPILIDKIYEVIWDLARLGRTILVVEENAARIADNAAQVALLDNGQFAWTGRGAELMARPKILETYLGA
ncbi:MAG: ABC transporter ATP-binding protein [Dongiaceae bacterium]